MILEGCKVFDLSCVVYLWGWIKVKFFLFLEKINILVLYWIYSVLDNLLFKLFEIF